MGGGEMHRAARYCDATRRRADSWAFVHVTSEAGAAAIAAASRECHRPCPPALDAAMSPLTAREAARRLIAREQAPAGVPADGTPVDATVAPERAVQRLCGELTTWFGPYAVHVLLTRALAHARADHPVLVAVRIGTPPASELGGLRESARAYGALPVAAATTDMLAVLVEVLGRLIGDELAASLIAQTVGDGTPPPHQGRAGTEAELGGTRPRTDVAREDRDPAR